jgi:hypothetical protein
MSLQQHEPSGWIKQMRSRGVPDQILGQMLEMRLGGLNRFPMGRQMSGMRQFPVGGPMSGLGMLQQLGIGGPLSNEQKFKPQGLLGLLGLM